jgi:hypothetical protein
MYERLDCVAACYCKMEYRIVPRACQVYPICIIVVVARAAAAAAIITFCTVK